jgi:acetyl-CoA carboxylase/biotin carboxylase 1
MADRIGVAALWPRWGHASDVPELLEMLLTYEILFLGPLAQPMDMSPAETDLGSVLFHD